MAGLSPADLIFLEVVSQLCAAIFGDVPQQRAPYSGALPVVGVFLAGETCRILGIDEADVRYRDNKRLINPAGPVAVTGHAPESPVVGEWHVNHDVALVAEVVALVDREGLPCTSTAKASVSGFFGMKRTFPPRELAP